MRSAAGEGDSARHALNSLCEDYWNPVYAHVLYRVRDSHLAEDLTQDFFSKFLSQDWFLRPRESRGKFRTFLLTVLRRFLNDQSKRSHAWKRGGRNPTVSLDELPELASDTMADSSSHFDRAWAQTLLHSAFVRLKKESDSARFQHLFPFLQREPDQGEYQTLTDQFGITSNTIAAAVRRMRRRLRDLLREEIRQTLDDGDDIEEEMRHLLRILAS